jgi:predicted dehydrogenase
MIDLAGEPLIGILGAGSISDYHIRGLQMAGGRVGAIFSLDLEGARSKAEHYGIPIYTDRVQELLDDRRLTAVVIATPDFTHAELAIAAAQAGKAMLVQKPMARNSVECRVILDTCQARRVACYVSFMHRYFPEIEALRQVLASGELGQICMLRQRNATPGAGWAEWFYRRDLVGGGVAMQLGIHGVDLLRYLFGEIEAVKAVTAVVLEERSLEDGRIIRPDNEDLALATYRFASGLMAIHEMSYNEAAGTDRFRLEVYGSRATAWLRSELGGLSLRKAGQGWQGIPLLQEDVGARQHAHWLAMLRGEAAHDGSHLDGMAAVQVVEAIYRAALVQDWVKVEQRPR